MKFGGRVKVTVEDLDALAIPKTSQKAARSGEIPPGFRLRARTRGEAAAWCWNLFQYEPHGFVHPGSQLRAEALTQLRAGGLPEVFGYPERASELAGRGITARQYRQHREELGSRNFDPADVRRS